MLPLSYRCWQARSQLAMSILLCFCVLGLVPDMYGQTDNVGQLIGRLNDKKTDVRDRATDALIKIGTPAVDPLIAALKNPHAGVRGSVAHALGEIKEPRAVDTLIAALKDPDLSVRGEAADALAKIGAPAVDPLIVVRKDPDAFVRRFATKALSQINDPRTVEPLLGAMKDSIPGGRILASHALSQTNDPRAISALLAALAEHDKEVIAAAYPFFIGRGEPGSEDALIESLNWIDNFRMSEDFLNSGNAKLEEAARAWARQHGYQTKAAPGGGRAKWGSAR